MGSNTRQPYPTPKKALRAIVGAAYNAHTSPILKKLKLLNLPDLHNTKMLCYHKNYLDNKLPIYIKDMFNKLKLLKT